MLRMQLLRINYSAPDIFIKISCLIHLKKDFLDVIVTVHLYQNNRFGKYCKFSIRFPNVQLPSLIIMSQYQSQ